MMEMIINSATVLTWLAIITFIPALFYFYSRAWVWFHDREIRKLVGKEKSRPQYRRNSVFLPSKTKRTTK